MAVTLTAAMLRLRLNIAAPTADETASGVDVAVDLLAVASELVQALTPATCPGFCDLTKAVVRVCGWLKRGAGAPDSLSISGTRLSWRPTPGRNALRSSGAAGLLAPWHRPRALVLENGS